MLVLSEICFERMAMGEEISLLRLELFSNGLIETADPGWRIFTYSWYIRTKGSDDGFLKNLHRQGRNAEIK
ncbi:hypothetical protein [Bacillus smithii]|uniref:hypothetical protein n=1 Tax=Bacillus smithii TaxID=1479 RepID=UPI003D234BEC